MKLLLSAVVSVWFVLTAQASNADAAPELMLANHYSNDINPQDYWVSEKYDGFRAYWNGSQLLSRQGNVFQAPNWFIENFPKQPLDGELWLARGKFQTLASIVKSGSVSDEQNSGWTQVSYKVFDLPSSSESFDMRLLQLKALISSTNVPWLNVVAQQKIVSEAGLLAYLDEVVAAGAEGLMLHKGSSIYQGKRSDDLLKLKKYADAEARVIEYQAGKGKYTNMMGALVVKTEAGLIFKLGSGFSDQERKNPPPLGSLVTYRYNGFSDSGLPRFARYLRLYQPQ